MSSAPPWRTGWRGGAFASPSWSGHPALRTGGYLLDFSGAGYDVAQRMNLVPTLSRHAVQVDETRLLNKDGRVTHRIDMHRTLESSADRYMTIARSDLTTVIYSALDDCVETIFGDTVRQLRHDDHGVEIDFEHSGSRRFDLVIGCDGLHSTIRRLTFGASPRGCGRPSMEIWLGWVSSWPGCARWRPSRCGRRAGVADRGSATGRAGTGR